MPSTLIAVVPQDDPAGCQRRRNVDEPLVGRAAEPQSKVLFLQHERAVHQHVDAAEHLPHKSRVADPAGQQVPVEQEARKGPHIFAGAARPQLPQQFRHGGLVGRLERLAAKQGQPGHIGRLQGMQDRVDDVLRKRLAIGKIPCFGLEAALAVVRAARDEQACPHAGAVCDITGLDCRVIHACFLPSRANHRNVSGQTVAASSTTKK